MSVLQSNDGGTNTSTLPGPNFTMSSPTGSYIPATQRPNGTWRKPRRVKEGYIPQEEVPLYQSKGKIWAESKPTYPVGMSEEMIKKLEAAKAQGAKKKKKKKPSTPNSNQLSSTSPLDVDKDSDKSISSSVNKNVSDTQKSKELQVSPPVTNPANRLRNLRKKIKEIENLEQQIKSNEVKNPDKDQLAKIKKRGDYEEELRMLMEELKTS